MTVTLMMNNDHDDNNRHDQQQKQEEEDQQIAFAKSSITRSMQLDPRIVGGTPAEVGEYPWYAVPARNYMCGASLIHPDILLTVAHCSGAFVREATIGDRYNRHLWQQRCRNNTRAAV
jgi:V8-like Glu-specific endopeptidase